MWQTRNWIKDAVRWRFPPSLVVILLIWPIMNAAQGLLEIPAPGSFQSAIDFVRGWVC